MVFAEVGASRCPRPGSGPVVAQMRLTGLVAMEQRGLIVLRPRFTVVSESYRSSVDPVELAIHKQAEAQEVVPS